MKSFVVSLLFGTRSKLAAVLFSVVSCGLFTSSAWSQDVVDPAEVKYVQTQVELQGIIPYSRTYAFTLQAPASLAAPAAINFDISPDAIPAGVSSATAISYVAISPATATFTAPSQIQTFTVVYSIPANAVPGSYGMKILAQGFVVPPEGLLNGGTFINAAANPSSSGYTPPTVTVAAPLEGQVINVPTGSLPVSVNYSFQVTSLTGTTSPITAVDMQYDLVTTPVGSVTGVGTNTATVTGSVLVTTAGTHTIKGLGTNLGGQSSSLVQFTVVEQASVAVAISTPTDGQIFSYAASGLPTTIPLQFQATSANSTTVAGVSASLGSTALSVASTGLGSTLVNGTAQLPVAAPGVYSVTVNATNNVGNTASDTNQFSVVVTAAPPVATIASPIAPANVYTVRAQGPAVTVPISFQGVSSFGGIRGFSVTLDGAPFTAYTTTAMGQLTVTGSASLTYSTAGDHTFTVTSFDDNGTSQVASTTFRVNYVAPTPTVALSLPNGLSYTIPYGCSSFSSIPFSILSTSDNGFFVDAVTISGGSLNATISSNSAPFGTAASITSLGTLTNVPAGSYTLTATATSAGVTVSKSITFAVNAWIQPPLPTVVINTPAAGATYTVVSGNNLSIPLTFTGTSNAIGGVITGLTAKLGTTALAVTSTTLGQKIATGSATLNVCAAGTYTISVTAVDANGTANATRTFSVTVVQPKNICGSVFFDADADNAYDCGEFGLAGITVNLLNSASQIIKTTTTGSCGDYSFTSLAPGSYTVTVVPYAGLKGTSSLFRAVTISSANVTAPAVGLVLDFAKIRTLSANGYTIGFWKTNIDKAVSCKTSGIQIPSASLSSYTTKIGDFALTPFDCITMKSASATMGSTSSTPKDLLGKQLLASEYNYQNGAYIGGNKNLTFVFLWWGEYVLKNASSCSSTYLIWAKDWFDAYNNTHGGVVAGPN